MEARQGKTDFTTPDFLDRQDTLSHAAGFSARRCLVLNRRLESRTLNQPVLVVESAKVFQIRLPFRDRPEAPDPQENALEKKPGPKAYGGQADGVVWVKRLQPGDVHPPVSCFRQPQRFSLGRRFLSVVVGGEVEVMGPPSNAMVAWPGKQ